MNHVLPSQYSSNFLNYLLKSAVVRFAVQTKNTITNNYSNISQIGRLLLQLINAKNCICPWCCGRTVWTCIIAFPKCYFLSLFISYSLYSIVFILSLLTAPYFYSMPPNLTRGCYPAWFIPVPTRGQYRPFWETLI